MKNILYKIYFWISFILLIFCVYKINTVGANYFKLRKIRHNIDFQQSRINYNSKNIYIDDEISNVSFKNVLAVKRNVYVLQWKEIENKGKTEYKKVWTKSLINSDNFKNKKYKNPKDKIKYTEELFTSDATTEFGVVFDSDFIKKYATFTKTKVNKIADEFCGAEKTNKYKKEKIHNKNDLDDYLYIGAKPVKIDREKFLLLEDGSIVNIADSLNPKVGDIKIEYESFAPKYVFFIKDLTNNSFIDFENVRSTVFSNFAITHQKMAFETVVITVLSICFATILFLSCMSIICLKKGYNKFILKFLPYFNEYITYSNSKILSLLLFVFLVGISTHIYIISTLILLVILYLRNRDFYSI